MQMELIEGREFEIEGEVRAYTDRRGFPILDETATVENIKIRHGNGREVSARFRNLLGRDVDSVIAEALLEQARWE